MIGLTVLWAGAALVIPIKEDDHAGHNAKARRGVRPGKGDSILHDRIAQPIRQDLEKAS